MANRFWVGGTDSWNGTASSKWATTSGGTGGAAEPTNADDVFFDGASGANTITVSGTRALRSLICTGFTGTLTGTSTPVLQARGSITLVGTMTLGTVTFNWIPITSFGSASFTSAGLTISALQIGAPAIGNAGQSLLLQDDMHVSGNISSNSSGSAKGLLDLNGHDITLDGSLTSGGNGCEGIRMRTGTLFFTGTGNLTATTWIEPVTPDTGTWKLTNTSSTARTINNPTSAPTGARSLPIIWVSAGSGTVTISSAGGTVEGLNFTGFSGTWANQNLTCNGSVTLSATMTATAGTGILTMAATSGTKVMTSNGLSFDRPITFNGAGGTFQLADAWAPSSARTTTLTAGTFDMNGQTYSTGLFSSSGSGVRSLTGSGSVLSLTGTGTVWDSSTATNLTIGSGVTIKMTNNSASAKTFAGGTATFGDVWNATAGAGQVTYSGSHTVKKWKIDAGLTVNMTAGMTLTLTDFPEINGVYNSTKTTLQSTAAGSAWTISKATGLVLCDYLSLKDSAATGGASFYANQSTNVSGNSGWIFSAPGETIPAVKGKLKKQVGRGGGSQRLRIARRHHELSQRSLRRMTHAFPLVTLVSSSDSLLPKITDTSSPAATLSRSDSLLPKIDEGTSGLASALSRSDSILPKIDEGTSGLASALSRSDSILPRIDDSSALAAAVSRSDSLLPKIDESSALAAAVSRSDSLLPKIDEGSSSLASTLSRSDLLLPRIDDSSAIEAALSIVDSVLPRTTEASSVVGLVAVIDSLLPRLDEGSSGLTSVLSRSDSLSPRLDDVSSLVIALAGVDSLLPRLDEASAVLASLSRSDSVLPRTTEASSVVVALGRVDSLLPRLDDAASLSNISAATDLLAVILSESSPVLMAALSTSDTIRPRLSEVVAVLAILARLDEAALTLGEVLGILSTLERTDELAALLDEEAGITLLLAAADDVVLTTDEASDLAAFIATLVLGGIKIRPLLEAVLSAGALLDGDPDAGPALSSGIEAGPLLDGDPDVRPAITGDIARNRYQ